MALTSTKYVRQLLGRFWGGGGGGWVGVSRNSFDMPLVVYFFSNFMHVRLYNECCDDFTCEQLNRNTLGLQHISIKAFNLFHYM